MAVQNLLLDIIRIRTRQVSYTHVVQIAVPYAYGCTVRVYAYTYTVCIPYTYVTGFRKITLMGALLIQRKTYFTNLKLCYSSALAATCLDFSAKIERFTTLKSS